MIGVGVILNRLGGNDESARVFGAAIGKRIVKMRLRDDVLTIRLEDGTGVALKDDGQSCCEWRYMRTDDDLEDFDGSTLLGGETRDAPDVNDGGECHEVQFLVIKTDKGDATFSSHNEHNGYYGGFSIRASAVGCAS